VADSRTLPGHYTFVEATPDQYIDGYELIVGLEVHVEFVAEPLR
jgi:hypothetical protein